MCVRSCLCNSCMKKDNCSDCEYIDTLGIEEWRSCCNNNGITECANYRCFNSIELIRFSNGSEIKILKNKNNPSNVPMMIYGIDMAQPDSVDNSCIGYCCSKCKSVFHVDQFSKNEFVSPELYVSCPRCKVRFKGWIQS